MFSKRERRKVKSRLFAEEGRASTQKIADPLALLSQLIDLAAIARTVDAQLERMAVSEDGLSYCNKKLQTVSH